jgi:hypothetical protein
MAERNFEDVTIVVDELHGIAAERCRRDAPRFGSLFAMRVDVGEEECSNFVSATGVQLNRDMGDAPLVNMPW